MCAPSILNTAAFCVNHQDMTLPKVQTRRKLKSHLSFGRTWNPVYPNKYYIEQVTADFSPACPPLELGAPGHYGV